MKMKIGSMTDTSADLSLDDGGDHVITIHCDDVTEHAPMIARAVNLFPALVSALTPFRSNEMGDWLVAFIDMREENSEDMQKRLSRLINMIDVILDAAEEPDDDIDDG
jgi:hypothetical protein